MNPPVTSAPDKRAEGEAAPGAAKKVTPSLWYKDAVIYQIHIRAFSDSDSDGIGDFRGLAERLDYFQDLGVTALWLLPFYPSPLRDEGYDIADYTGIHAMYGSMNEFRAFLREAHKRELKVITELVINHTSDQHRWFKQARAAPRGSKWRNYYVWSDTPDKYQEARVIFKDFESSNWSWDPVAHAYFWHRFYAHQPDLNFDNPEVRKAVTRVLDFWLEMGVDGLRLDAVPYLYEREGTSCENLPETHEFLKEVRRHVDEKFPDRMLLAEANQWPEDAVAYFGNGDECHMAFHFPIMPRMFMGIHMEDCFPIVDIFEQTPAVPETSQWAIFLRNHDELTLEMVTDEERDYMYRVYATDPQARLNLGIRRRLAPLLGNNRRKIELMNGLLFSLPGTPVVYYGDEIGMGDNIYLGDRNGVRTPMQWSGDRNAGFSKANPQKLYSPVIIDSEYHYETVNVESQQNNPHSMLWWMKRLIALRKNFKVFGRGAIEFLNPENRKILAFIREFGEEKVLVVANLSRFVQYVELDLSRFKDMRPVELFGKTPFPKIGELPYFITLGPHGFFWFSIEAEKALETGPGPGDKSYPQMEVRDEWHSIIRKDRRRPLEKILPDHLRTCRWFAGKDKKLKELRITEAIEIGQAKHRAYVLFLSVSYVEGEPERYALPVTFLAAARPEEIQGKFLKSIIAKLRVSEKSGVTEGVLCDAIFDSHFCHALLDVLAKKRTLKGETGEVEGTALPRLRQWWPKGEANPEPSLMSAEQSNSCVAFGDKMIMKFYRRIQTGRNPDLETNLFLSEHTDFPHIARTGGYLEYKSGRRELATLSILQEWVPNQGDAWQLTLDQLVFFYERVLAQTAQAEAFPVETKNLLTLSGREPAEEAKQFIGEYLEQARRLGVRTAELHTVLSSGMPGSDFSAEPLTYSDLRSLYQSMRNQAGRASELLSRQRKKLTAELQVLADHILAAEEEIVKRFRPLLQQKVNAKKIRCHGDFHLGQVLSTGKDFVILDFEGEPVRSVAERRLKRSPFKDVGGMIRSFHYAAFTVLWTEREKGRIRPQEMERLEGWAKFWYRHVSAVFLRAYLEAISPAKLFPTDHGSLQLLLDVYLLEKALYEIGYELRQRPQWIRIPIQGIVELIEP